MPKKFTTQPPLFVHAADLDYPILLGLDDAEAVLNGPNFAQKGRDHGIAAKVAAFLDLSEQSPRR